VVWSAGIRASEFTRQTSDKLDHLGRVPVDQRLRALPEVFAGDTAAAASSSASCAADSLHRAPPAPREARAARPPAASAPRHQFADILLTATAGPPPGHCPPTRTAQPPLTAPAPGRPAQPQSAHRRRHTSTRSSRHQARNLSR
jgi:hypothetical protein